MKRLIQRAIVVGMVVGVVGAVMPLAGAVEIGDDGPCRPPTAGWDVQGNPPSVYFYADPGKICFNA